MTDVAEHDYFEREDLFDYPARLVYLRIQCQDVIGFVTFNRNAKARFRVGDRLSSVDVSSHIVDGWRPIDLSQWVDDLPQPKRLLTPPPQRPVEAPKRNCEAECSDSDWPAQGIRLGGRGEAPVSLVEVEARILRYLRTLTVRERDVPSGDYLWPKPFRVEIRKIQDKLGSGGRPDRFRSSDYSDYHIVRSNLEPRMPPFRPTSRDIGDYDWCVETCMREGPASWIVSSQDLTLYGWRSDRPPHSWPAIATKLNVPEDIVREWYSTALAKSFERAREHD